MSWKQTAQYALADAFLVEHKALSKLDDVHEIIDWKQIETTFSHLYASKRGVPALVPTKTTTRNWVKPTIESCTGLIATRH